METLRPKARGGLLSADHSKKGRRLVSVLDKERSRVTLLEPWEHAVLVLCDGNRSATEIAAILAEGVEGEAVNEAAVSRCFKYFGREELFDGPREQPPAGPRTLANLQQAYREWHKDPLRTGQIFAGLLPFPMAPGPMPIGLEPTVALPDEPVEVGSTLVLGSSATDFVVPQKIAVEPAKEPKTEIGSLTQVEDEDLLEEELDLDDVADLLAAVDDDFAGMSRPPPASAAFETEAPRRSPPVGKPMGGIAELPHTKEIARAATNIIADVSTNGRSFTSLTNVSRQLTGDSETQRVRTPRTPEKALNPTMVGRPPTGAGPPEIVAPPRPPSRAGSRVAAVIGPVPTAERPNVAREEPATQELAMDFGVSQEVTINDAREEPTTSRSSAHLPARVREVFERLRRSGTKARGEFENGSDPKGRRRHRSEAKAFAEALDTLTAGDLELALGHFRRLSERLPGSVRVRAFVQAIEATQGRATDREATQQIVARFGEAVAEAVVEGRCPRCLAGMEAKSRRCGICGFED